MFIIGMHRSGTSALARAFYACGATTGDDVLAPMDGVNSEGFWEDRSVVALNEDVLQEAGLDWYSIGPDGELPKVSATIYQRAKLIIERGFGEGDVELVKDPRLCLTLPLWLRACEELDVSWRICVIRRKPAEVARSLQKRDGFPLSYGCWLAANYEQAIERVVPRYSHNASTTFDRLLQAPAVELKRLLSVLNLPLSIDSVIFSEVVEGRLKHQCIQDESEESDVGCGALLQDMVRAFVVQGHELSDLGEEHAYALSVVDERDRQIRDLAEQLHRLGDQHGYALSVVDERDRQIRNLAEQLHQLGDQHGYAISIVEERDKQLAACNDTLTLHRSWKKKVLLSLGLINREK